MAKQRTYYENGTGNGYRPVSRYIRIRFNNDTEAYFIYKGRREYINDWGNLSYPVMVEDTNGKLIVIGSYKPLCNWGGLLLEIHPDCEYIRIWEEVTG